MIIIKEILLLVGGALRRNECKTSMVGSILDGLVV